MVVAEIIVYYIDYNVSAVSMPEVTRHLVKTYQGNREYHLSMPLSQDTTRKLSHIRGRIALDIIDPSCYSSS